MSTVVAMTMCCLLADPTEPRDGLGALELQIAAGLERPHRTEYWGDPNAIAFNWKLTASQRWPCVSFQSALLKLLEDGDARIKGAAALALLNYDDPNVQRALQAHEGDTVRLSYGPVSLGTVLTERRNERRGPLQTYATQLPISPETEDIAWDKVGFCLVPEAVAALRHSELSIRLQAFAWLAARVGIILDATPLQEGWSRLDAAGQHAVLECINDTWCGGELVRDVLERIVHDTWAKLTDRNRELLFEVCGRYGGRAVRPICLEVIRTRAAQSAARDDGDNQDVDLGCAACRCLGQLAEPNDLQFALEMRRSRNTSVRFGSLHILAALDDPIAMDEVAGVLRHPSEEGCDGSSPCDVVANRDWTKRPLARERYTRSLIRLLEECVSRDVSSPPARQRNSDHRLSDAILALEVLNQRSQGPTGVIRESSDMVNAPVAHETGRKWVDWYRNRKPGPAQIPSVDGPPDE